MLTDPYDNILWNDQPGNNPISNDYGATDAWCDPGQAFLNNVVLLDGYAGQNVTFRFRIGTAKTVSIPPGLSTLPSLTLPTNEDPYPTRTRIGHRFRAWSIHG